MTRHYELNESGQIFFNLIPIILTPPLKRLCNRKSGHNTFHTEKIRFSLRFTQIEP